MDTKEATIGQIHDQNQPFVLLQYLPASNSVAVSILTTNTTNSGSTSTTMATGISLGTTINYSLKFSGSIVTVTVNGNTQSFPVDDRTFIKINCAAIPAGLIESELFGHEEGAFTGAIARKIGRLELAHDGTLFLDEVGELPLDLQPKLLRALQEKEIERVGGSRPIPVNVRLIAATNRDLGQMVAEKQFRSDLYYRLKVFPAFSPPLRERTGDIPILVRHFVATHSRRMGKHIETIPEETMAALTRWQWPGNIRELENFLERAVILTRGGGTLCSPRQTRNRRRRG